MSELTTTRHNDILEMIAAGEVPVLPFEVDAARVAIAGLAAEQRHLGVALTAAMTESSETWHDNAAADAVAADSKVLAKRAQASTNVISKGVDVGYPSPSESAITLGSLVTYHYEGDDDKLTVLVTGATRKLPEHIEMSLAVDPNADFSASTLSSPLTRAMLGRLAGHLVEYEPSLNKKLRIAIDEIGQYNPLLDTEKA